MKEKLLIGSIVACGIIWGALGYKVIHQPISSQQTVEQQKLITTTSASDWKTYKNTYYGFELSYPPNFSVSDSSNGDVVHIIRNDKNDLADSNIYIDGDATKGIDLKTWAESMSEMSFSDSYKIRSDIFAGRQAEVKYDGTFEDIVVTNPFESQPGYLRIETDVGDPDSAQTLKTFKFTDQTPTPTSDWKTYINPGEGYSFKYPADHHVYGQQYFSDANNSRLELATPDDSGVFITPDESKLNCDSCSIPYLRIWTLDSPFDYTGSLKPQKINLNGIAADLFFDPTEKAGFYKRIDVYGLKENLVIEESSYDPVLDAVLATFK